MDHVQEINKYAFVVIKPDAMKQFLDIPIVQELSRFGLQIIKYKIIKLNKDQVATIYKEKSNENYYPLLEEFLTGSPCTCLLLKSEGDAIKKSHEFKDEIRRKFKIKSFDISDADLELLKLGKHPQQEEITKEMAIENLIHAADNFEEVLENIKKILSQEDLNEIREREPQLYRLFLEYRRKLERYKELPRG